MNTGRDQIGGLGFVIKPALQRAIGANQRFERVPYVGIHRAGRRERGFQQPRRQKHQKRFMLPQEFFGHLHVAIGNCLNIHFLRLFVVPRFH